MMLQRGHVVAIVMDVQEKLVPVMHNHEALVRNMCHLVQGLQILKIPVVVSEQRPEKLGPTVTALRDILSSGDMPLAKKSFSVCADAAIQQRINDLNRRHVILCGIEAHVCVTQSALDFVDQGYTVTVVADAISSRRNESVQIALERMKQAGVWVADMEMVLFELLGVAEGDVFKSILNLVK